MNGSVQRQEKDEEEEEEELETEQIPSFQHGYESHGDPSETSIITIFTMMFGFVSKDSTMKMDQVCLQILPRYFQQFQ